MPLNIKDAETDRLARQLAREAGESITVAARTAIEERLARLRARAAVRDHESDLRGIVERGRARAVIDDRTDDEILGYGPDGLPR